MCVCARARARTRIRQKKKVLRAPSAPGLLKQAPPEARRLGGAAPSCAPRRACGAAPLCAPAGHTAGRALCSRRAHRRPRRVLPPGTPPVAPCALAGHTPGRGHTGGTPRTLGKTQGVRFGAQSWERSIFPSRCRRAASGCPPAGSVPRRGFAPRGAKRESGCLPGRRQCFPEGKQYWSRQRSAGAGRACVFQRKKPRACGARRGVFLTSNISGKCVLGGLPSVLPDDISDRGQPVRAGRPVAGRGGPRASRF